MYRIYRRFDMSDKLSFRFAQRKDAALIFDFIMRIAEYEKMTASSWGRGERPFFIFNF